MTYHILQLWVQMVHLPPCGPAGRRLILGNTTRRHSLFLCRQDNEYVHKQVWTYWGYGSVLLYGTVYIGQCTMESAPTVTTCTWILYLAIQKEKRFTQLYRPIKHLTYQFIYNISTTIMYSLQNTVPHYKTLYPVTHTCTCVLYPFSTPLHSRTHTVEQALVYTIGCTHLAICSLFPVIFFSFCFYQETLLVLIKLKIIIYMYVHVLSTESPGWETIIVCEYHFHFWLPMCLMSAGLLKWLWAALWWTLYMPLMGHWGCLSWER